MQNAVISMRRNNTFPDFASSFGKYVKSGLCDHKYPAKRLQEIHTLPTNDEVVKYLVGQYPAETNENKLELVCSANNLSPQIVLIQRALFSHCL